jgi:hypothetical protein
MYKLLLVYRKFKFNEEPFKEEQEFQGDSDSEAIRLASLLVGDMKKYRTTIHAYLRKFDGQEITTIWQERWEMCLDRRKEIEHIVADIELKQYHFAFFNEMIDTRDVEFLNKLA